MIRLSLYRLFYSVIVCMGLLAMCVADANPVAPTHFRKLHPATKSNPHGKKDAGKGQKAQGHDKHKKQDDDKPKIQPFDSSHNKLYRSYIPQGDITHVDPYTGNMTIHLPLIRIPSNDNLPLQVTLTFDNHLQSAMATYYERNTMEGIPGMNQMGYGWTDFVGVYDFNPRAAIPPDVGPLDYPVSIYSPIFVDPTGKLHQFYATRHCLVGKSQSTSGYQWTPSPCTFISKDNWYGTLKFGYDNDGIYGLVTYSGTINAPDGNEYTLSSIPVRGGGSCRAVTQITSPNKGTTLTYHYDDQCGITSITRNDGFTVTFHNTHVNVYENNWLDRLDSVSTSDGRTWRFDYEPIKAPSFKPYP